MNYEEQYITEEDLKGWHQMQEQIHQEYLENEDKIMEAYFNDEKILKENEKLLYV